MPTIVVTEGSSDSIFLKDGLDYLYPHLKNLYKFFDFGISNARGGVGEVKRRIETFIGAGIPNRIVVIFDNDTTGIEIKNKLIEKDIPPNIRVISYPVYEFLKNHPTIGRKKM